ncbi:hypothetical protein D3C72_1811750 [compost metagenome]
MAELQVRGVFHVDQTAQLAAQELGVSVQRLDDHRLLARRLGRLDPGAQGFDETDGVTQVRRQTHLGDGDRHAVQGLVVDAVFAQDVDQGVADQFAGAQLAL